ncbi:hypothetical protein RvY_15328 [Ramazzottius varieornatus]|uniref:Uncharacterized protein n=1 Tax=Ramazzottius varieornatus TaxID=947166 RepID=A0A1D1VW50_RAMVA|nr:hypothetical protein RvY_15328 [Ramazzottius varieornatus]
MGSGAVRFATALMTLRRSAMSRYEIQGVRSFGALSEGIRRLERVVDEVQNLRNLCVLSKRAAFLTREQVNKHLKDPDFEPRLIQTRGSTGKAMACVPCIARHAQGN